MQERTTRLERVDGSGEEILFNAKNAGAGPGGFSSDGKKLLFMALDGDDAKIRLGLWDFAAKSEQILNDSDQEDAQTWQALPMPCWVESGTSLLMVLPSEKGRGVFRLSADRKRGTRLTPEGVECLQADWTGRP